MTLIKTTALCTLALAAMALPQQADAHAFMLKPQVEIASPNKNLWAYVIPGKSVPPENAYFTGDAERNSQGFTKNYKTGNWKTLKEFIFKLQEPSGPYQDRPAGGTAECGFTNPNAKPQPLPDQIEYGNYQLSNRIGIHPGPCEAWCDDEIVVPFEEDCRKILYKPIPYDKTKCAGKSRMTFYWVATHFAPFQVYTSCAPLQGATPGAGARANSTAPAPANAAPKATPAPANAAPKATPAPVGADADQTVKCKVKKN